LAFHNISSENEHIFTHGDFRAEVPHLEALLKNKKNKQNPLIEISEQC
jgi:hypothetical protein